jgi:RNA polymerase sigma-70 factor (ECF subfamily)
MQQRVVPERIAAWLFRVAGNLAREEARRGLRRSTRERLVAMPEQQEHSPGESLERDEVRRAVEALSVELRAVIIARLWAELTLAETAEALQISISTVHRRYEEGLVALRRSLEPYQPRKEYHVP